MKRRPITAAMKLEVLMKLGRWDCYRCQQQFWLNEMQWDHVRALVDGGEHHPSNLRPVCVGCHREKSAFEVRRWAKHTRLEKARKAHEAVLAGEPKKPGSIKSRGFQGHKKFNGEAVWRKP